MLWAAWVPGQSWLWKSLRISIVSTRVNCCNMKEEITESLAFFDDLLDLSNTNEVAKSGIWCVPTCFCARVPHVQRRCSVAAATASQRKAGLQRFSIQQIRKYLQSRTYCPPCKTIISWIGGSDILKTGKFSVHKKVGPPYLRWHFLCKMIGF